MRENALRNLEWMRTNKKKRYNNNTKCKNLNTVNFNDLPKETRTRLHDQILLSEAIDGTSVVLLVINPSMPSATAPWGCGRGRGNSVILMINVPCLAPGSPLKQVMQITIQSNFPHIVLQFGPELDAPNCPSICCAVDTCAAISTGNFYFFTAVAKQYPHCLTKLVAPPADYAQIILSGIVQTNNKTMTTKLKVGFQFHLPFHNLGGDSSSLLMATGPNVLVNMIVGLPFIQATGMIFDFVDKVAECKHLD
jgi:hypothetical protein